MAITVEDLYAGLLGRTPDVAGLQYWQGQFGSDVDANELQQFRQAAAAEIARQQQNDYAQELAAANVQRVAEPAMQTAVQGIRGVQQVAAERAPLEEINSLLAAPPTGSKEAGAEAYALNQQVLQMDKFRIEARQAYDNPALFDSILAQIQASDLQADRKQTVTDLIRTDIARLNAATAENPNVTSGQYISNAARALDDAFGGVLGTNQANALSLDFRSPVELAEAIQAFQASNGRLLPEDALRVARQYDAEDARNIGLALNTSSNSRGQEGLLGSTFGVNQAISRYNPQSNEFVPDQGGAKKDVFAAQFNAALNIGDRLPSTEGLTAVGDPEDGFFTKKLGNPGAYDLFAVYKLNPNTGEAVQVGTSTNFNPELSGFKKFVSSPLGQILIGVGTGLLLPGAASLVAGALGTGTVASSVIAGGLLGAAGSAITGGDILTGALMGGAGGAFSGYIGTQGGLGNTLKNAGFSISDDIASTLNRFVSGNTVASADDIFAAKATISAAQAAGGLSDDAARVAMETIEGVAQEADALGRAGFRLTPNQVEDFLTTPTGGGTLPAVPTPVPGSGLGSGIGMGGTGVGINPNAPGIGFNINPEDFIPTPVGAGTLPPPTGVNLNIDARIPPPIGAGTLPPTTPSPNVPTDTGLSGALRDVEGTIRRGVDDAIDFVKENPLTSAAVAASIVGQPPQSSVETIVPLPAWVTDPSQSAVLGRIQAAQAARPAPMPNLFNAQFQRGGLGAGQFIGYDLLNRTGDIPQQTLLGVSPLAMPPMNLLGINYGQAPTSAPALV